MEEHQRRHITDNLLQLIRWTPCNTTCISILTEKKVLSIDDVAEVKSISNELKKSEKLYEILLTKKDSYPHLITALEEGGQTGALEILKKLGNKEQDDTNLGQSSDIAAVPAKGRKTDKAAVRYDVYEPVQYFTGREPQLSELHRKLQENLEKRAVISQTACIVGLGGIGKTELARKYVQQYGEEFYDGNVIWIRAQTKESLTESFCRLASDHLHISLTNVDKKELDITTIIDRVYSHFNEQRVIFVFDNAESTDHFHMFMPLRLSSSTLSGSLYILITSRDREWSFSAPVLELDEMSEEDAISFVKRSLKIETDDDDDAVLQLANRLQQFPLALSQAVSFIKQRRLIGNFSISKYLDSFEAHCEKRLGSKRPPAEFNSYRETTLTTWKVTTKQIYADEENGQCAMNILNSISFFLPDNIPFSMFYELSKKDEFEEALHLLVKYSMVNVDTEKKTLSVHRLVQEVTRIHLKQNNQEDQAALTALEFIYFSIMSHLKSLLDLMANERSFPSSVLCEIRACNLELNTMSFSNMMENFEKIAGIFTKVKSTVFSGLKMDDESERRMADCMQPVLEHLVSGFVNGINTLVYVILMKGTLMKGTLHFNEMKNVITAMSKTAHSNLAVYDGKFDEKLPVEMSNISMGALETDEVKTLFELFRNALDFMETQQLEVSQITVTQYQQLLVAIYYRKYRSKEILSFLDGLKNILGNQFVSYLEPLLETVKRDAELDKL